MKINNEFAKLNHYYHEHKLAHAYLISTNNISLAYNELMNVVKSIFCPEEYENGCTKCSFCHLIDLANFPSIKIIEPLPNIIKKEQILELQQLFSTTSQITNSKIYIIKNAEKMNKEATNTLLKFLEEPTGEVYGFFLTNNKDGVLDTIISRCQIIDVFYNEDSLNENLGISEEKYTEMLDIVYKYLNHLEVEKTKNILYNKEDILNYFKERIDIINLMKIIFDIYYDAFMYNISSKSKKYSSFDFVYQYSVTILEKKLEIIKNILNDLKYNVSFELILDRFVIEMSELSE